MVRFYSSSLLTLLILRSTLCLDCITPVKSCPCSEEEWKTRSATYQCTDLSYACMLTFNNTLVEACIYDYQIKPAATGCPTIYSCIDTLPLLTIEEDFTTCPIDKKGCPPADHTGYSLSKLYQFPECTRRTASSSCSTNITIIIEEGQSGSLKVALGVLVPICILALLVATICYLRKRHLNRRRRANRKIDFEADYIPAPTFDVEFYGKQLLLSSGNFFADIGKCRDWLTRAKNEFPGEISSVINYMDKYTGSTPLSEALYWEKKDVVALLLMEGADFEILNEMNENPVQRALLHADISLYRFEKHPQTTVSFLEKLLATSDQLHMTDAKLNRFKDVVEKKQVPTYCIKLGRTTCTHCRSFIPGIA